MLHAHFKFLLYMFRNFIVGLGMAFFVSYEGCRSWHHIEVTILDSNEVAIADSSPGH